jgi:hypothetical protein
LSGFVFERKVDVAGSSGTEVGDFTFDPKVGEFALDFGTQFTDKFADFPDTALGGLCSLKGEAELNRGFIRTLHNFPVYMGDWRFRQRAFGAISPWIFGLR